MRQTGPFWSELLGTFILVFIGCGVVATSVLFGIPNSLLGIATVWGGGVTLAIFAAKPFGPAHLNPAVSVAMWVKEPYALRSFFGYVFFQFIGALLAGMAVYGLFRYALLDFEHKHEIVRGSAASVQTSKIFGEFYHQFDGGPAAQLSTFGAGFAEFIGTFLLVMSIFFLIHLKNLKPIFIPPLIGLTVAILIVFIAPYTQAGLNPARDFGPRLVASFMGWGEASFPPVRGGFFTVYILSPLLGGIVGAIIFRYLKFKFPNNRA